MYQLLIADEEISEGGGHDSVVLIRSLNFNYDFDFNTVAQ